MPRTVQLERQFAQMLTLAVETTGAKPKDIRVEDLDEIEGSFACRIPDPVIAYFAAGLGDFYGDGKANTINAIKELTEEFRETVQDAGQEPRYNPDGWMVFENDNANYLGFPTDAERDQQTAYLFDHEGAYTDTPIPLSLAERLREFIRGAGGDDHPDSAKEVDPFEVTLIHPAPKVSKSAKLDEEIHVEHPTFGRGLVLSKDDTGKHEKWKVEFDGGETKLLVAKFLDVVD
jgi:hypothetical protein